MSSLTLAKTAVRLAGLALTRDRSAAHQCFRVKNFNSDEVVQFVQSWPETAAALSIQNVKLIVADSVDGRVPPEFVAEAGRSITHYRNHNRDGLVYLETSQQSDEQGLQNMFSLRDSNFLDGSFDDYASAQKGVPGLVVQEAWSHAGGAGPAPELLLDRILFVIRLIHPHVDPVPVRRFVAFAEMASALWLSNARAVDSARADEIIGEALWAMDMFPDVHWNDGSGDARCRRRLEVNARHADLIDGTTDLDASDIEFRADATQFADTKGNPLDANAAKAWKLICVEYGRTQSADVRQRIPYWIFSQLFARDTAGLRLGDKVRSEVYATDFGRLSEFDSLDVVQGLNGRSTLDAVRFLESVPPEGLKPLPDLLSVKTRRAVERLAVPVRRRFFNPAIEIVRLVQRVRNETSSSELRTIEIRLGAAAVSNGPAHGLFVFMFGDVLRSIAEHLHELPGACELIVGQELVTPIPPPIVLESTEELEDSPQEIDWSGLPLRVRLLGSTGRVLEEIDHIEWCPPDVQYHAMFWLLATSSDSPYFEAIGTLGIPAPDGEDWISPLIRREVGLDYCRHREPAFKAGDGVIADQLLSAGLSLREGLSTRGLDVQLLRSFLDTWTELLTRAREDLIPDGTRPPELEAILGAGMLAVEGTDRRLMLSIHPIKLRWICNYLDETKKLAQAFLSGDAAFADGEGELYLDWLESLTPSESPPIAIGQQGQLLYSRSEIGWHEDFAPLEGATGDLGLDVAALGSIAQRVANYLEVHPYKRDGLSLLIVLPTSDAMPAELLDRIAAHVGKPLRFSLHVAAPRKRWEAIARSIEQHSTERPGAGGRRLFPDRDLALIDYRPGSPIAEALSGLDVDIAVVTHVLQEQVVSQQNTESPVQRPGTHDPLRHRPLRLESGAGGGAISLVMLPRYPDNILESWSTLVVRTNRSRPVAPSQSENIDFVELRVNFQDSARLFHDLHSSCHWVITLERHISREQIESVEAGAPDILSIEEGIGLNGLKTLIVSSQSGRDLIQSRLARKLRRLIPGQQQIEAGKGVIPELAAGIYDATRLLSPKLALQALGVARVTEEIIGLTVARRLAEQNFPVPTDYAVSAWLSLDEHAHWFGGHAQIRADMCRLTFVRDDAGKLWIDVLVVEGKLRQLYDGHGVLQVRRTCDFFRSILASTDGDGAPKIDSVMWRESIAAAIENLADAAVRVAFPVNEASASPQALREELLSQFRSGKCSLRQVAGLYSACLWESEEQSLTSAMDQGVHVLRSTRFHLLDMVSSTLGREISHRPASENSAGNALGGRAGPDSSLTSRTPLIPSTGISAEVQPTTAGAPMVPVYTAAPEVTPKKGMPDLLLRRMYEQVLGCFAVHGLQVSAAAADEQPYVEGPASVLFKVRPGTGVDPRKLSEKAAALKLALELEQDQNVAFNIDRGFVTIDVPKQPQQRYFVDAGETWTRWARPENALTVPIGEDQFGNLVELNFSSSNSPHLLVAGTTGSGKSEALNTILFGLVKHYQPNELRLLLVDPKGTELLPFEGSKYLEGSLGWDDSDALQLLRGGSRKCKGATYFLEVRGDAVLPNSTHL